MLQIEELNRLVSLSYEAALAPGGWAFLLGELAAALDAQRATYVYVPTRHPEEALVCTHNFPEEIHREFVARRETEDYWARGAMSMPARSVYRGVELVSYRQLRKSGLYPDAIRPMDCEVLLGGFFERNPSLIGGISVLRSASLGEFDEQARQLVTLLFPHLRNAAAIHGRLTGLAERADAAQQALELLADAVLLLDVRGRLTFANRSGYAMLSAQDGLALRAGRLRFLDDVANSELDARLTIVNDPEQRFRQPGAFLVARRAGKPPLRMLVAPVVGGRLRAALAILVESDDPHRVPVLDRLQACFGMTLAEARLVAELFGGATLREAAATLHVTLNTVRAQLKSARHKVGARSQAALLKAIAASGLLLAARS